MTGCKHAEHKLLLRVMTCVAVAMAVLLAGVPAYAAEGDGATTTVIDYEPTGTENPISDNVTRLSVSKYDADTEEALEGAKLCIYAVGEDGSAGDAVVDAWTTGKSAKVFSGVLSVDTIYMLRELEAPTGYVKVADTYFVLRSEDFNTKGYITNKSGAPLDEKDLPDYVRVADVSGSGNSQAFIINLYDSEGAGTRDGSEREGSGTSSAAATRSTAVAERLAKTGDATNLVLVAVVGAAGAVATALGLRGRRESK